MCLSLHDDSINMNIVPRTKLMGNHSGSLIKLQVVLQRKGTEAKRIGGLQWQELNCPKLHVEKVIAFLVSCPQMIIKREGMYIRRARPRAFIDGTIMELWFPSFHIFNVQF